MHPRDPSSHGRHHADILRHTFGNEGGPFTTSEVGHALLKGAVTGASKDRVRVSPAPPVNTPTIWKRSLKTGEPEIELNSIEIDINKSCLIPADYINDIYTRLKYYKKISSCKNKDEINIIKDEIIDIFGPIPEFLNNLFILTILKLKIMNKNIKYIKIINQDVKIEINNFEKIKINNIIVNAKNNEMKISKDNLIHFKADDVDFENQSKSISNIINKVL